MSEKLNWVELRQLVATRAGGKDQEAARFLNALIHQIQVGLKNDKSVKINGIGTFRVQAVAPRKSVNVSTGETITIEGYNKLSFNAEAGVKELMQNTGNKHVAAIDDEMTPLRKLGEQADEIVDILAELGQAPKVGNENENDNDNVNANEDVNEDVNVNGSNVEVTPDIPEEEPKEEQTEAKIEAKTEAKIETKIEAKPEKKGTGIWRWIRDIVITIIILLLLLFGGIYLLREGLAGFLDGLSQNTEQVENDNENGNDNENVNENVDVDEDVTEAVVSEPTQIETTPVEDTTSTETPEDYSEFIATEEMHQDSRLAWMAYRYYGKKELWVFIYDANRDNIKNPDHIQVGTPIRIPKLSKQQMDTQNPQTQQAIQKILNELGK